MPRQTRDTQYVKNYKIVIRVTYHEDKALRALAQRMGVTISTLLRNGAVIAAVDYATPKKFSNATVKAFSKCPEYNT